MPSIVYVPQPTTVGAGRKPLHEEVGHYSCQKWTGVESGSCGWNCTESGVKRKKQEHRGCWEGLGEALLLIY